jgi:SNF2 family DNA or RNA helicase
LIDLRDKFVARIIATGTPITEGIEYLYGQLSFLSEDILGYDSYTTFTAQYCMKGGFENKQIVGYRNTEEISRKLSQHGLILKKKDCVDLPDKIHMNTFVELTKEQRQAYKEMRANAMILLSDTEAVTAANAMVQILKLQQILCGFSRDDDGNLVEYPNNRVGACIDAVEAATGKVIVWARFHYDLDQLGAALKKAGVKFVEYSGRIDSDVKEKNKTAFMTDPSVKVFLGTPRSGGTGLNLTIASTQVFYSNEFSAESRWQAEDRIHRIGQTVAPTYIDLMVPGTVDERIATALKAKHNVAHMMAEQVKAMLEGTQD